MILVPNVQQMIIPLEQVIFQNGILYFKTVMADWGITGLFNGKKLQKITNIRSGVSLSKKMIIEPTMEVQLYRYK